MASIEYSWRNRKTEILRQLGWVSPALSVDQHYFRFHCDAENKKRLLRLSQHAMHMKLLSPGQRFARAPLQGSGTSCLLVRTTLAITESIIWIAVRVASTPEDIAHTALHTL